MGGDRRMQSVDLSGRRECCVKRVEEMERQKRQMESR